MLATQGDSMQHNKNNWANKECGICSKTHLLAAILMHLVHLHAVTSFIYTVRIVYKKMQITAKHLNYMQLPNNTWGKRT